MKSDAPDPHKIRKKPKQTRNPVQEKNSRVCMGHTLLSGKNASVFCEILPDHVGKYVIFTGNIVQFYD